LQDANRHRRPAADICGQRNAGMPPIAKKNPRERHENDALEKDETCLEVVPENRRCRVASDREDKGCELPAPQAEEVKREMKLERKRNPAAHEDKEKNGVADKG